MEENKKAKQLVEKFALGGWSKEHAINCVDEIIDAVMTGYLVNDKAVAEFQKKMMDYYRKVKIEIEAMP